MENRINSAVKLGRIPEDERNQHPGFAEWNLGATARNHQAIVQILIDGRDSNPLDTEGSPLPTLVYVAREKRPQYHHNFKAGAMNVLIRVSSEISNAPIILNVDCDMYSNNSEAVREALCFIMDEEKGHEIAYVQFPQNFNNTTKNDLYSASMLQFNEVDYYGLDNYGGPVYIGSGCFHRRRSLCGHKYSETYNEDWRICCMRNAEESNRTLEEKAKALATCTYEQNTQWGKEVGLKYGCPVEDVISGLTIKCKGWKSVYCNPARKAFLGVAPMTLAQTLVQHKRWSEGDFQIFLSEYCPVLYGNGRIKLGLQMAYSFYCFWAANALPTLFCVTIPSLCLANGIALYPRVSNVWFIPFGYVITTTWAYSLGEWLWIGGTLKSWWNEQRMWMFKRTTSYLFAFIDTILKQMGFNETAFVVTAKVSDDGVSERHEREIMEFGPSSPLMFNILSLLAMLNLFCLVRGAKRLAVDEGISGLDLFLQLLLCGVLVLINMPIYQALFLRRDAGRMPTSIAFTSVILGLLACLIRLN